MTDYTIGVDISKEHLDACRLPDGAVIQFNNDKVGLRDLIRWIGKLSVARIVYEPTGAYHRGVEDVLSAAGLPLVKVNPLQVRRLPKLAASVPKLTERTRRYWRGWAWLCSRTAHRFRPKHSVISKPWLLPDRR